MVSFYNGVPWVHHKLTLGDVRAVRFPVNRGKLARRFTPQG